MANDFLVEFTEDGLRKRERTQFGNFDGDVKQAQALLERIWGGSNPDRTDIKVISIAGSGRVEKVPIGDRSTPEGDAAIIAKNLKKSGDA